MKLITQIFKFQIATYDTDRDENGRTALHRASESGQANVVRWLLEKGADVTAVDVHGYTPLLLATTNNEIMDIVKIIHVRDFKICHNIPIVFACRKIPYNRYNS